MPHAAVVPVPLRVETRTGPPFVVGAGLRVLVGHDPAAVSLAVLVASRIGRVQAMAVAVLHDDDHAPGTIELRLAVDPAALELPRGLDPELAQEAYRLEAGPDRVIVAALAPAGLVRGVYTLRQLARRDADGVMSIDPVLVVDHPRFAWRGLSLDLARHFFGVDVLKQVVNVLARLRLNVLHLHLTDDQGWRLQVPSRPALTEVSGRTAVDGDPGGFLTLEDFADLVTYASVRQITVVPEIDLPGHVNAALHAYGELTPSGEPTRAYTGMAVGFSRLYADVPATGAFVSAVLGDVIAMTPGPYVHIGGDEALTMGPREYAHLVTTAADHVRLAGKIVVGWQETAAVPLPPGTVVQYWDEREPPDAVVAAVARGARVLLSPASRVYLERHDDVAGSGWDWVDQIGLFDAYAWEPAALLPIPADRVIGVEAALWTEAVRTPGDLFRQLLPRLAAVSEVAWSAPQNRDWGDFLRRLPAQNDHWDFGGIASSVPSRR